MPIYEYRCKKCQVKFEVIQKVGANGSELICIECGQPHPEKVMSLFSASTAESINSSGPCSPKGGFT